MTGKQAEKARFTPGPWIVFPFAAYVLPADRPLPDDAPICALLWPTEERSEEETQANAALIAAAPKMYEALKRLVAERDDDPERYPLEPTCNECTEGLTPLAHDKGLCHWHEARAAIAAAEGR